MALKKTLKNLIEITETVSISDPSVPDIVTETPETILAEQETKTVREAIVLMLLSPLEVQAFSLRYGLFNMGVHLPIEIAKIMKRPARDVRDIIESATNKITWHHKSALQDLEKKLFNEKRGLPRRKKD